LYAGRDPRRGHEFREEWSVSVTLDGVFGYVEVETSTFALNVDRRLALASC